MCVTPDVPVGQLSFEDEIDRQLVRAALYSTILMLSESGVSVLDSVIDRYRKLYNDLGR